MFRCGVAIFILLSMCSVAWAQEGPTVTIASKEGSPQSEVALDVTLSGAEAADARSITAQIQFPRNLLAFARAESKEVKGTRTRFEGKMLQETPKSATLELTIAPGMTATTKTLPDGVVGQIYFTISADAPADTKIPLKATVKAVLGEAAQAKAITVADSGTVSVVQSLIFSCFFYMH